MIDFEKSGISSQELMGFEAKDLRCTQRGIVACTTQSIYHAYEFVPGLQVSFFTYHGVADENHFHRLEQALNHPLMNMDLAQCIAKTAKMVARLYHMQLEELGNY